MASLSVSASPRTERAPHPSLVDRQTGRAGSGARGIAILTGEGARGEGEGAGPLEASTRGLDAPVLALGKVDGSRPRSRFLLLGAALAACSGAPSGGEEDIDEPPPSAAKTGDDAKPTDNGTASEEQAGQVEPQMRWSRPLCSYVTWQCGECICNACNVIDCRMVVYSP